MDDDLLGQLLALRDNWNHEQTQEKMSRGLDVS